MTAVVLHLSDIHVRNHSDPILHQAQNIAAATFGSLPEASIVFIVVSGDIAYSGKSDQYELASEFLRKIREAIVAERGVPVQVILSPGNHDCDFDLDTRMRQIAVKSMVEDGPCSVDDSVIDQCAAVQQPYFDFRAHLEADNDVTGDKLWRSHRIEAEGKTIVFDCLNISWVSRKHEEQGALVFPYERYVDSQADGAELRILVMHHPLNWFSQGMYRGFRSFVRKNSNIIITGHEHVGNVGENIDAESGHSAYVEGCVLQGHHGMGDSSFNVLKIELADGKFLSTRYVWNKSFFLPSENGSWADYRDLPRKRLNPFEIANTFRSQMDDPGAYFKHPNRASISLADIYVFPDLTEMSGNEKTREILSSSALLDPSRVKGCILVTGEEKAGCTSLLYRLYEEYHDRGFVPLYLSGRGLRKTSERDLDQVVKRAVEEQYGPDAYERFFQLSSARKLLLLDDFDDSPEKAGRSRAETVVALRRRFGHAVVMAGELFDFKEMVEQEIPDGLGSITHYRMMPLGFALRTKLIQRWFQIGNDSSMDDAAFVARWDQAERLIDSVLQRNVVPAVPLFLLTLLQGIDAGRSGDFKESALGFYYQYLLTEGFQNAGVRADKLTEVFEFSTRLAWRFHTLQATELNEHELRAFNDEFSAKFQPGDLQPRLEQLTKAKVLVNRGAHYEFRYPYAYYFLKGRYLSQYLREPDIQAYVKHCCTHLYVRENANTILFLAHHANDEFVVKAIVDSLCTLFSDCEPLKFSGDTVAVAALIENAPSLQYSGVKPEEHRARVSELKDELDDGDDGLAEKEEEGEVLSIFAQLTVLFKTVEILGQILKNQYARIERPKKVELITELFAGPLRSLRSFYTYFEKRPDYLVAEIDATLEKRGKLEPAARQRLAKATVARVIQAVSFGFVQKAAVSVSAEALMADVRDAVAANGTIAYRLIHSGVLLDAPGDLPRDVLRKLKEAAGSDVMALRILQLQVLNHLYMFRTSEQDKQWLASKQGLELDLGFTRSVDFRSAKSKLLK